MIHIHSSERAPVDPARFNEAYMMHGSTSPFYPMIAALDVAAAMMDGPAGTAITDEAIREAIHFRKRVVAVGVELAKREGDGWFFGIWQPDEVRDAATGTAYPFVQAPNDLLATSPHCWMLEPDADWHGFTGSTAATACSTRSRSRSRPPESTRAARSPRGHPGRDRDALPRPAAGSRSRRRATTRSSCSSRSASRRASGERCSTVSSSSSALRREHAAHRGACRSRRAHPGRYARLGLRDLCDEMHAELTHSGLRRSSTARSASSRCGVTPGEAYRRFVRGQSETVPLGARGTHRGGDGRPLPARDPDPDAGRVGRPRRRPAPCLPRALEAADRRFPGFEHDIHGVERSSDGAFMVACLKDATKEHPRRHAPAAINLRPASTKARGGSPSSRKRAASVLPK